MNSPVKVYTDVVDKSSWPRGEWDNEPDKLQWEDETTGYTCILVRGPLGNLCGYVAVPEGHPLYKVDYGDVDFPHLRGVHGGVTFSNTCADGGNEAENICHIPDPGDSDHVWWFGFDCGHGFDFSPKMAAMLPYYTEEGKVYRSLAYVRANIDLLAAQLKELEDAAV